VGIGDCQELASPSSIKKSIPTIQEAYLLQVGWKPRDLFACMNIDEGTQLGLRREHHTTTIEILPAPVSESRMNLSASIIFMRKYRARTE
jgi:hypothetical protein